MTRDDQALRLIVTTVLSRLIDAASDDLRDHAREAWMVGDRIGAVLAGRPAGHAQLRKGSTRATVTDPQAFEAWVSAQRPDEVELVSTTRVRPAYQAAVLASAKKLGVAVTADGEEIPGVTVATGDPTVAVILAEGAAELVAAAWQSGELWELIGGLLPALDRSEGSSSLAPVGGSDRG